MLNPKSLDSSARTNRLISGTTALLAIALAAVGSRSLAFGFAIAAVVMAWAAVSQTRAARRERR